MSPNIDRNAFLAHLFAIWKSIGSHLSQRATLVTPSRRRPAVSCAIVREAIWGRRCDVFCTPCACLN